MRHQAHLRLIFQQTEHQLFVLSAFQDADVIAGKLAAPVEQREHLLLLGSGHASPRTGHRQRPCSHRQVLAQRFGIAIHIKDPIWEKQPFLHEILASKIKEGDIVLLRCQHIGDQC